MVDEVADLQNDTGVFLALPVGKFRLIEDEFPGLSIQGERKNYESHGTVGQL